MIRAIVAANRDGVIAVKGKIPWHYPQDLARFKELTIDSTIVMGRKTWESLPRKPLPQRRNIVVTSRKLSNVETRPDLRGALTSADTMDTWIIGGAQLYQAGLPWCDTIDVTWVPDETTWTSDLTKWVAVLHLCEFGLIPYSCEQDGPLTYVQYRRWPGG
jgi:dihydrofolate reductase